MFMTARASLRLSLISGLAVFAIAERAHAQAVVNAGADQFLDWPERMTRLQGSVTNRTPLDFWVADGDNATENRLIKYNEYTGVTVVGPLQTTAGIVYGWPSDFEKVYGVVYGIETYHKRLYTLDGNTGICTPIGSKALGYSGLFGLAYDYAGDKLYCVDQASRKLLILDRTKGTATVVLTLPSAYTDIRGIAFRPSDGKIYYCDDKTEAIYRVDLTTKKSELVMTLNDGPNAKVDELDYYYGHLFGNYRTFDTTTGIWSMQLVEFDVDNKTIDYYGPVLTDLSAHSLLINSIPEKIHWVQVAGPSTAHILQPTNPESPVTFDNPGKFEFELRAEGVKATSTDRVVITVRDLTRGGPPSGPRPAH